MILIDTGPLVGRHAPNDPYHSECLDAESKLEDTMFLTTWPCFSEAMYLLGRYGGFQAQLKLWHFYESTALNIWNPEDFEGTRMATLMAQYQDQPMDLADASLVAAAESTGLRAIFTLDHHFGIYQLFDGSYLTVVP